MRARIQSPVARALTAANPYHRYVLDAERRMFEGARLKAVICNSEMVRADRASYAQRVKALGNVKID